MLRFGQQRWSPIQDGEADDVDKKIRERNDPDKFIAKDLPDHKGPKFRARFLGRRVTLRALHFRQTNRSRSIGQCEPDEDDAAQRDKGRNKKTKAPIDYNEIAAEEDDKSAPD